MSARKRSLDALAALRWPTVAETPLWAHAGALAGRIYGVPAPVEHLDIIASGPLPIGALPSGVPSDVVKRDGTGGQRWTPEGGIPITWRTRTDHYADMWQALAATGSGTPKVVSGPALVALALQTRTQSDAILRLLMAGHIDVDDARATVLTHLGPYALDDLEAIIQDAEWQLMRQRYAGDGDVH